MMKVLGIEKKEFENNTVRLFPIYEKSCGENRATSIFLATLMTVRPFKEVILHELGRKVGTLGFSRCFAEIPVPDKKQKKDIYRFDGVIQYFSNAKDTAPWECIIEAKTGNNTLCAEQLEKYSAWAKEHKVENILTISNEFSIDPKHSPVSLKPARKNAKKSVNIFHFSWHFLATQAYLILESDKNQKVDFHIDEEQRYILEEFCRFIWDDKKSFSAVSRMHGDWKECVKNIKNGVKVSSESLENVLDSWLQETADLSLIASRLLHKNAEVAIPKVFINDKEAYSKNQLDILKNEAVLSSSIGVKTLANTIQIDVDINSGSVSFSMEIVANQDKKKLQSSFNHTFRRLVNSAPQIEDAFLVKPLYKKYAKNKVHSVPFTGALEDASLLALENVDYLPEKYSVSYRYNYRKESDFTGSEKFIKELEVHFEKFIKDYAQYLENWIEKPTVKS